MQCLIDGIRVGQQPGTDFFRRSAKIVEHLGPAIIASFGRWTLPVSARYSPLPSGGNNMRFVRYIFTALALAIANEAAAQATVKASFAVGNITLEVPIPSGFCMPSGSALEKAKFGAASDPDNVTHLTLYNCAQMQDQLITDYYLIKTPRNLVDRPLTRAEVLDAITKDLADPAFDGKAMSRDAGAKASKSISEAGGVPVQVTTDIRQLGRDTDCAYQAGVIASGSFNLNMGGCITAVGDRLIFIFRYSKGTTVEGARALLPEARKMAVSMKVDR